MEYSSLHTGMFARVMRCDCWYQHQLDLIRDLLASPVEEPTPIEDDVDERVAKAGYLLIAGDIEEAMEALSGFFDEAAENNSHPAVKGLLESCRDSARSIGFEWYASFK